MGVKGRREDIVVASLLVHSLAPTRGVNFAGRAKSVSIKNIALLTSILSQPTDYTWHPIVPS